MKKWFIFSIMILAVQMTLAQDPCTALSPNVGTASWFGSIQTLKNCFNSIRPNILQALSTVDAIKRTIDLYSFTDISLDSGAPYYINIDLRSGIFHIDQFARSQTFRNDYHFHERVMELMNPLFDAHTLYRAPNGYGCYVVRPHNIEATLHISDGSMRFYLRQGPLGIAGNQYWQTHFGQNVNATIDKHVTHINDLPVAEYLKLFVDNFISTYKDQAVRFNAALRGRYSQVILTQFPLNGKLITAADSYTLADGQKVTLANAAFCPTTVRSSQELENKNRLNPAGVFVESQQTKEEIKEQIKKQVLRGIDIHKEMEEEWQQALKESGVFDPEHQVSVASLSASEVEKQRNEQMVRIHDYRKIHKTQGKEFHSLDSSMVITKELPIHQFNPAYIKVISQSSTADTIAMMYSEPGKPVFHIFRFKSFLPVNETDSLRVLNDLLLSGQQTAGSHLLVDVANNGGGSVCLSDLLIAVLVEQWGDLDKKIPVGQPSPLGLYDFRQSHSSDAIIASPPMSDAFAHYNDYLNPKTMNPWGDRTFFAPLRRARGGLVSGYTQQGLFPAPCVGYPGGGWQPVRYYFKNIYVLTDGTCGSACALFASQLQSNNFATVISYGGYVNNPIPLSTASFAGGNVLEYQSVAQYAALADPLNKALPPIMNSSGRARFNFNEYYEMNDVLTPREFLKRPAQLHIEYWATLYNDNMATPLGLANCAALYGAVTSAIGFQP